MVTKIKKANSFFFKHRLIHWSDYKPFSILRSSTSSSSGNSTRPPGVTQEDQDVSKALEASLMESNKRRRSQDNGNPEERKRIEGVSLLSHQLSIKVENKNYL